MPYFRRGEGVAAGLPTAPAALGSAAGLVDKAAAILASQPPIETQRAAPHSSLPVNLSHTSDLSDLQQRLSELLAGFLQLIGQSSLPTTLPLLGSTEPAAQLIETAPFKALSATIPVLEVATPVPAGSTATLALTLVNDGSTPVDVVPYCSDLISSTGHQIAATHVTFSPRTLPLAVGARDNTQVSIEVPQQVGPGRYSMLVQAMGLEGPRAVVVVRVS